MKSQNCLGAGGGGGGGGGGRNHGDDDDERPTHPYICFSRDGLAAVEVHHLRSPVRQGGVPGRDRGGGDVEEFMTTVWVY